MTKHKRYGGQQTRGLYPHPEFTRAQHIIAVGAKERERERDKKLFPNKVPLLVNAKEKISNPPVGFFFFFFSFSTFTAIVPVMEVRRYNFTG